MRLDSCLISSKGSFLFSSRLIILSILLIVLFHDYGMFFFSVIVMMPLLTKTSLKVNIVKL